MAWCMHAMWRCPTYKKGIHGEREENEERKKERKEDMAASSSDFQRYDSRSYSSRELKFVYSTRATLQEVGILPTLVYFHPKGTSFQY